MTSTMGFQDPERESAVRSLFERAVVMARPEREELFQSAGVEDGVLEEVKSLLRHHDSADAILDRTPASIGLSPAARMLAEGGTEGSAEWPSPLAPGLQLGSYTLVRSIGHGGMGVVWEAEQAHPRRRVALKLVRPELLSPGLLRRLEREAEVLGKLDHPGIALVFEAGAAKVMGVERPFIAMELVEGRSLRDYVRESGLSEDQLLDLFAMVCDAVDHAHTRGVIHRDLKPGNVIVDASGRARVLDFGVARIVGPGTGTAAIEGEDQTQFTRQGQIIGTLGYVSPEQCGGTAPQGSGGRGDGRAMTDPRSDVYSLGVMLYELIAGTLPIAVDNLTLFEAMDAVRTREPVRLSVAKPGLARDLEAIVGKALEKSPADRYQSAAAFAEDIRRYRRLEAVSALPQTGWYQARKFARRNRLAVGLTLGAVGAVVLSLSAGLIVAVDQANTAKRAQESEVQAKIAAVAERERAKGEARTAEAVTQQLLAIISQADPDNARGKEVTIREAVEAAAENVETDLRDAPEARVAVYTAFGSAYYSMGQYEKAIEFCQKGFELGRTLHPDEPQVWYHAIAKWSAALERLDRPAEGEALIRRVLEESRSLLGTRHTVIASLELQLGATLRRQAKREESEALVKSAIDTFEALYGKDDKSVLAAVNELSLLYQEAGRFVDAAPLARRNYEMTAHTLGEDHPDAITAATNFALLLGRIGKSDEAVLVLERQLPIATRVWGLKHPEMIALRQVVGVQYLGVGRTQDALNLFQGLVPDAREVLGSDHDYTLSLLNNTAVANDRLGNLAAASEIYAELEGVLVKKMPESIQRATVLGNLGRLQRKLGQYAEAVKSSRECLRIAEVAAPEGHPLRPRATLWLGAALLEAGAISEGIPLVERGYREASTATGVTADAAQDAARVLATHYEAVGDSANAEIWKSRAAKGKPGGK